MLHSRACPFRHHNALCKHPWVTHSHLYSRDYHLHSLKQTQGDKVTCPRSQCEPVEKQLRATRCSWLLGLAPTARTFSDSSALGEVAEDISSMDEVAYENSVRSGAGIKSQNLPTPQTALFKDSSAPHLNSHEHLC